LDKDQLVSNLKTKISDLEAELDGIVAKEDVKSTYKSVIKKNFVSITRSIPKWEAILQKYIANGSDIDPQKISPKLYILRKGEQTNITKLFRVAQLNWSIPLSSGFGRRIRGLVFDEHNEKLIGIFGMCDPVYNRKSRDNFIGWTETSKNRNLVNIMSTYILGSLPPYNDLLFGKFMAMIAGSKEIIGEFNARYFDNKGVISGKKKNAQLVGLINTTAFGKSSMMDRIKDPKWVFLGKTKGIGTSFQSDGIFDIAKQLVKLDNPDKYSSFEFGDGPNWKLRILRKAYKIAEIDQSILEKGNEKGVYFAALASNWREILLANNFLKADYTNTKSMQEMWDIYSEKVINRSNRVKRWENFDNKSIIKNVEVILNS